MSNDINSFEKLKKIEEELENLHSRKIQNNVEYSNNFKKLPEKNEILIENMNKTCMQLSKEVSIISKNLRELLNIFKTAIRGEVPEEEMENTNDLGSKIDTLVDQNSKLIERLDSMTQDAQINKKYDELSTSLRSNQGDMI